MDSTMRASSRTTTSRSSTTTPGTSALPVALSITSTPAPVRPRSCGSTGHLTEGTVTRPAPSAAMTRGNDNLVTWGFKPNSLFTEVDAAGDVLMDVTFPNGDAAYRTIKTPLSEFDADLLHRTAGLPAASFPPLPRLHSLGVETVGRSDRSTVTITGSGFTGATSVRFGSASASSFAVVSDDSITAIAPLGLGSGRRHRNDAGRDFEDEPPEHARGLRRRRSRRGTGSWSRTSTPRSLSRVTFPLAPLFALSVKPRSARPVLGADVRIRRRRQVPK